MKAIVLFISLFCLSCLVSCGSDKDKDTQTKGQSQTEGTTQTGTNNPQTGSNNPATEKSNTYQSPSLAGRHPEVSNPAVKCNINNYKNLIKKSGVHNCQLQGAILSSPEEKFFEYTDLSGANLRGANLRGAKMSRVNLSGADLRDADLRSAIFSSVVGILVHKTNLRGANLEGAKVTAEQANYLREQGHTGFVVTENYLNNRGIRQLSDGRAI